MKKESGFDNNGTATPGPSKININCDIKNTSRKNLERIHFVMLGFRTLILHYGYKNVKIHIKPDV